MSLFRSERMLYYEFRMPRETAWEILNEIGEIDCVQFIDQNADKAAFARPFSNHIERCRRVEEKLQKIQEVMTRFRRKDAEPIKKCPDVKEYLKNLRQFLQIRGKSESSYFEEIESEVNEQEEKIQQQVESYEQLLAQYYYFESYQQVLESFSPMLENQNVQDSSQQQDEEMGTIVNNHEAQILKGSQLSYLSGVIRASDKDKFQRFVFRITKGNCYINIQNQTESEDISDLLPPNETSDKQEQYQRAVFLIVYQGGYNDYLKQKLNKLCDSFNVTKYQIPKKGGMFDQLLEIKMKMRDIKLTLSQTKDRLEKNLLEKFFQTRFEKNQCSLIEELKLLLAKEKAIYTNMNLLNINNNVFYGYAWIAAEFENKVKTRIDQLNRVKKTGFVGAEISRINDVPKKLQPPTFFRTNTFTAPFQEIVDTYGIPRYREINPGLFTIAMFPFLFGVMFGDIGHGSILLVVGALMLYKYEEWKLIPELKDLLDLRYLVTMMGFFATYSGFIYNDFFSLPFNIFGSCYENDHETHTAHQIPGCVYPFGLDPKWYIARNELNFFNSYKMKLAVILGVVQMFFGVILKGVNAINFKQPLDFLFEFIPQIIFMCCTFVFMDAMIFIKWGTDWSKDTSQAPSIITQMINLALAGGSVDGKPLWDEESQVKTNQNFLMIAFIMVPIMLIPKVLILWLQQKNAEKNNPHQVKHHKKEDLKQPLVVSQKQEEDDHDDHHDISEVFVHQMIETIEFVLGSISNTASYLRLWALSLAHSQLAKTFFEKCIGGSLTGASFIGIFIGWFLFVNITFGVLMCMDVMECLLHALRLQWVEFQNKFFKADGHKFKPFSFQQTLNEINSK